MKRFATAMILAAIPATAVAQQVVCNDCDHIAPYFKGEGGFIGTVAEGADKVVFVASCGSVTTTGPARVDLGTASQLFNRENGLACGREGGSLQIAGLADGGWYWITDDMNSAVGSLVNRDILENETVDIASAGDGVTMTMGTGAVYLKETATGRVGLLPNILPEPPTAALRKCGYDRSGTIYNRRNTDCALGDGGSLIQATSTNAITGAVAWIPHEGAVTRPSGTGTVEVLVDLWANGSGHYTTDPAGNAGLGHPELATTALRGTLRLQSVSYAISTRTGSQAAALPSGGVTATTADSAATITIAADSAYCSTANNFPLHVDVIARLDPDGAAKDQVTPSLTLTGGEAGEAGKMTFTVVCP